MNLHHRPFILVNLKFPFQDKKKMASHDWHSILKNEFFLRMHDLHMNTFQYVFSLNYTYIARDRDRSSTR